MAGTGLRELIRTQYPNGSNPKPFPGLVTTESVNFGAFTLRYDSVLLLLLGLGAIVLAHLVMTRSKLGLAIRAVAQDGETARLMGINFERAVLITFGIGSGLAALAGVTNGLYYNEINFGMGLLLGVIGFSAAVMGGLGNIYGAILGGFLFAALQTSGAVLLPVASAYKDVFAFAVIILIMAWKPTGLIAERSAEVGHHRAVLGGPVVLERDHAMGGGAALQVDDGVQRRVHRLHAVQRGGHGLVGRDRAVADRGGLPARERSAADSALRAQGSIRCGASIASSGAR